MATSTTTSSLARWRPAVIAVSLTSAALVLWYMRQQNIDRHNSAASTAAAFASTSQPGLHRSNAIRRRSTARSARRAMAANNAGAGNASRGDGGQTTTTAEGYQPFSPPLTIPDRFEIVSVERLRELIESQPDTFSGDIPTVSGPSGDVPVSISGLRALRRTEPPGESLTEVDEQLAFYEFVLLRELLRRVLPQRQLTPARLCDSGGLAAYLVMLRRVGFYDMEAACIALVASINTWLTDYDEGRRFAAEYSLASVTFENRANFPTIIVPFWQVFYPGDTAAARELTAGGAQELESLCESLAIQNGGLQLDTDDEDHLAESVEDEDEDDGNADNETEASWEFEDDGGEGEADQARKEGQSLLNMLFHIAEDQSKRDGYVHRGVSCNHCNILPIRGVRYRCSNCPDYDLCESCEALENHPKTHLLYKIRIPAPFLDSLEPPHAPRYPGKLGSVLTHLPRQVSKKLGESTGRELAEIEAMWGTFKCLANADWPEDPLQFYVAIDRDCFDQCFLPCTSHVRRTPTMPIHDRLFSLFDSNSDGLIGFEEFALGVSSVRTRDPAERIRKLAHFYDLDGDNLISRKDVLIMFQSYFAFSRELTLEMLENIEEDVLEGATLRESLQGIQPISSTFTANIPTGQWRRTLNGKVTMPDGERVTLPSEGSVIGETQYGTYLDTVADVREEQIFGNVVDVTRQRAILSGRDLGLLPGQNDDKIPLLNEDWPPGFVSLQDARPFFKSDLPVLRDIKDRSLRRKIIENALDGRDRIRRDAVATRMDRRSFYPEDVDGEDKISEQVQKASREVPQDSAQEYLTEILQESLNELLDDLFRDREELSMAAKEAAKRRQDMTQYLDEFRARPGMERLCSAQITDSYIFARAAEDNGRDFGRIAYVVEKELKLHIARQSNPEEPEYAENLKQELAFGVIDRAQYNERLAKIRPVGSSRDWNAQRRNRAYRGGEAKGGAESSRSGEMSRQRPNRTTLPGGWRATDHASETDNVTVNDDAPLLSPSGHCVRDPDWDPTLPHHRPHKAEDKMTKKRPSEAELKYLLMLECLEAIDAQRGGPGMLAREEFEELMARPGIRKLEILGMLFDLITF